MIISLFTYILITELFYFLLSPILFAVFRLKPLSERLAIGYPDKHYDLFIHAASVGEVNGIKQLLLEMVESEPNISILITVNTLTGRQTAAKLHPRIDAILSPLDILHLRMKQLRLSKPSAVLIAETEIWPSLMVALRLMKIPVMFINARMSEKTCSKFIKIKPILAWVSKSVNTICAQTQVDMDRFSSLFSSKVIMAGNLKYNVEQPDYDNLLIREKLGYSGTDKIIVFGSSRPGEEKLALDVYDKLAAQYTDLKLIIAPRHLKRLPEILTLLKDRKVSIYSKNSNSESISIIDVMGHLTEMYSICDIAIIGGSFFPYGGHNPLEAAYYGKPIIMGPYHISCLDSVTKLKEENALIVANQENLYRELTCLLNDDDRILLMGKAARRIIDENSTSVDIHLEAVRKLLIK